VAIKRAIIGTKNPTTERLAARLKVPIHNEPTDTDKVIIRWGSIAGSDTGRRVINPKEAIKRCLDKRAQLELLSSRRVPVPRLVTKPPCVAREPYHSRGRSFFICHTEEEVNEAMEAGAVLMTELIDVDTEYRVHVIHGSVVSIAIKVPSEKAHPIIRSVSHGWKFEEVENMELADAESIIRYSLKAVDVLGLDFGAVDIALTPDWRTRIFEVNTAPGLSEERVEIYAQALKGLIG